MEFRVYQPVIVRGLAGKYNPKSQWPVGHQVTKWPLKLADGLAGGLLLQWPTSSLTRWPVSPRCPMVQYYVKHFLLVGRGLPAEIIGDPVDSGCLLTVCCWLAVDIPLGYKGCCWLAPGRNVYKRPRVDVGLPLDDHWMPGDQQIGIVAGRLPDKDRTNSGIPTDGEVVYLVQ